MEGGKGRAEIAAQGMLDVTRLLCPGEGMYLPVKN